jgi:hypothetical protein
MPIDPKHLLDLAKRLVGPAPGAVEADLRRGISTAYYALFHLLIKEAMTNFVSDPVFRTKVGRAFQHGPMRSVCDKYRQVQSGKNRQENRAVHHPRGARLSVASHCS